MTRTPEDTLRLLLDHLLAKDMDAVTDLWAPDGPAEFPVVVGASPRRLEGREAVRGYLTGYPDLYDVRAVPALTVHHTDDAATIVAEFSATGRTVATASPSDWTTSRCSPPRTGRSPVTTTTGAR